MAGERHLGHEEVDHVQVEGDGGDDVLVVGVALEQHVGVVDDEAREHDGGQEPVDGHGHPSQREADLQWMDQSTLNREPNMCDTG